MKTSNLFNPGPEPVENGPAMKIVLIRERFNPYGGAELRSAELVRSMLAKGHSVTVLSPAMAARFIAPARPGGGLSESRKFGYR